MRHFINIMESAVPSFVEHVTDDLLDEMIQTGKWVEHGGDLEDQWDGGTFEYALDDIGHSDLIGKSFEEVRHTPEFRDALRYMLMQAAEDQFNRLSHGDGDIPALTADSLIYRGITAPGLTPNRGLGVYWSQDKHQSLGRFIDDTKGGWLMVARVGDMSIDWPATIRSRLDLANGQDEAEIQLVKGSPVKMQIFHVSFENGRPKLYPRGYHGGKA